MGQADYYLDESAISLLSFTSAPAEYISDQADELWTDLSVQLVYCETWILYMTAFAKLHPHFLTKRGPPYLASG